LPVGRRARPGRLRGAQLAGILADGGGGPAGPGRGRCPGDEPWRRLHRQVPGTATHPRGDRPAGGRGTTMTVSLCPTPERWRAYLDGKAPAGEQPALLAHLDSCPACRRVLEQLAGGDSLLNAARRAREVTSAFHPRLEEVMARAREPGGAPPTQAEQAGP